MGGLRGLKTPPKTSDRWSPPRGIIIVLFTSEKIDGSSKQRIVFESHTDSVQVTDLTLQ